MDNLTFYTVYIILSRSDQIYWNYMDYGQVGYIILGVNFKAET